jgi:hypothetical protein
VPDEFPTLEAVALIGVIVAVVRTWQLRVALAEIPKLAEGLERALRAGDLPAARELCANSEAAAFARVGSAVLERLGEARKAQPNELRRGVRDAKKRAATAAQRKRGRDLVVAAVLIGAGAYALSGGLGVGPTFYVLIAGALVITALGPVLRRATLVALEQASDRLLAAAIEYKRPEAGFDAGPCPECGATQALEVSGDALGSLAKLGVATLRVCRECGGVRGRASSPVSVPPDPLPGVRTSNSVPPPPELPADPESEHQG